MNIIRVSLVGSGLQARLVSRFLLGLFRSVKTRQDKVPRPICVFFPYRLVGSRYRLIGGYDGSCCVRVVVKVRGSTRTVRKVYAYYQLARVGDSLEFCVFPIVSGYVMRVCQVPRSVYGGTCHVLVGLFHQPSRGVSIFFVM